MKFLIITLQDPYQSGTPTVERYANVENRKLYSYKCVRTEENKINIDFHFFQSGVEIEVPNITAEQEETFIHEFETLANEKNKLLNKGDFAIIANKLEKKLNADSDKIHSSTKPITPSISK